MAQYVALVLDEESRQDILTKFAEYIPDDWEIITHHITLHTGPANSKEIIQIATDKKYQVKVICVATNDMVIALQVILPGPMTSRNKVPHITLAINRKAGAKPVMSNNLTFDDWSTISPFNVTAKLEEVHN